MRDIIIIAVLVHRGGRLEFLPLGEGVDAARRMLEAPNGIENARKQLVHSLPIKVAEKELRLHVLNVDHVIDAAVAADATAVQHVADVDEHLNHHDIARRDKLEVPSDGVPKIAVELAARIVIRGAVARDIKAKLGIQEEFVCELVIANGAQTKALALLQAPLALLFKSVERLVAHQKPKLAAQKGSLSDVLFLDVERLRHVAWVQHGLIQAKEGTLHLHEQRGLVLGAPGLVPLQVSKEFADQVLGKRMRHLRKHEAVLPHLLPYLLQDVKERGGSVQQFLLQRPHDSKRPLGMVDKHDALEDHKNLAVFQKHGEEGMAIGAEVKEACNAGLGHRQDVFSSEEQVQVLEVKPLDIGAGWAMLSKALHDVLRGPVRTHRPPKTLQDGRVVVGLCLVLLVWGVVLGRGALHFGLGGHTG